MQATLLRTDALNWRRARSTNATDNGFPSRVPTITKPALATGGSAAQATAGAVYDLANVGGAAANAVKLHVYGAGANNATLSVRVFGWSPLVEPDNASATVWVPTLLVELLATLSSTPVIGTSGGILATTDLFADTLAITSSTANAGVNASVVSPANDATAAYCVVDLAGAQMLEFVFTTGGSATNGNALWTLL